jgi:hypothetical protein
MKRNKLVFIALTILLCVVLVVQYFIFHTLSYTFTIVILYVIGLTITGIYYNRKNMPHKKFMIYAAVLGFCLALLLSLGLMPLSVYKNDYLEINAIWYEETENTSDYIIKIYAKLTFAPDITDTFGSTTQIKAKLDAVDGLQPMGDNLIVFPASHWQGKTFDANFGEWNVKNSRATFSVLVWIKSSNGVDASQYTVSREYQLGEDSDPPPSDPSGDLWISQAKIEWSGDHKEFNLKVTAKNEYDERLIDVTFELDLPDEFNPRYDTEVDADDIISKQSRTYTFKDISIGNAEVGEEYEMEITVRGELQESGKDVSDTATRTITITEPPGPSWSGQQDKYTEVFAEMFQQVVNDSLTATTIACIFLGSIAIIMGKSSGDRRAYYFGSVVAVLPVIFTIFSLYFGWVPPSDYFVELAGPNLASFTQAIITLVVLFMFLFVPYVAADVIGSPYE